MPILSITEQPGANRLVAAYRPIILRVEAAATGGTTTADRPPVVYCDCYIAPPDSYYTYHKSLSRTQSIQGVGTRYFEFDIQDAVQECVQTVLPPYGGQDIIDLWRKYIKSCMVRFRSSGLDSDGLTVVEDAAPIQATDDTGPTGGTGTPSETFYVFNATLQHLSNQSLNDHLVYFCTGTWHGHFLPVTHRPAVYFVTPDDSDYFPLYMPPMSQVKFLRVKYRYINQVAFWTTDGVIAYPGIDDITGLPITLDHFPTFDDPTVLYAPTGPRNLQAILAAANVNIRDIAEYSVQFVNELDDVVAETTTYRIARYDDFIRIHFQNYLGTIDALNFGQWSSMHETKSDVTQRPTSYPLDKARPSQRRFNVKSNDSFVAVSAEYDESAQAWIDELLDAPNAWMEVPGIEGQNPGYVPIVITDRKAEKRKVDERYIYEATLEFKLSHERIIIRN